MKRKYICKSTTLRYMICSIVDFFKVKFRGRNFETKIEAKNGGE